MDDVKGVSHNLLPFVLPGLDLSRPKLQGNIILIHTRKLQGNKQIKSIQPKGHRRIASCQFAGLLRLVDKLQQNISISGVFKVLV